MKTLGNNLSQCVLCIVSTIFAFRLSQDLPSYQKQNLLADSVILACKVKVIF